MKNPLCCTALPKAIWWLSAVTITPLLFFFMLQSLEATIVQQLPNLPLQVDTVDDTKKLIKRSDEFLFLLNGCIKGEFPLKLCEEIYHLKKKNKKESSLNIMKSFLLKPNKD